jgi:Raf kinase inhibitor-like YbhB/YbcL family protein
MAQTQAGREPPKQSSLEISSSAFEAGGRIPQRYTGEGEDVPPPLRWSNPPQGTRSFALICDDPDAPSGTFVHWLAWNIPDDQRGLGEAAEGARLSSGQNGFGRRGYGGPMPPPGKPHRYMFHVYALDRMLELPEGASRARLESAMRGHVLAEGVLTGTYAR